MADLVTRLHTAAAALTQAIEAADTNSAWDAASPCEGWTAGDVADHIIDNYLMSRRHLVVTSLGPAIACRTG